MRLVELLQQVEGLFRVVRPRVAVQLFRDLVDLFHGLGSFGILLFRELFANLVEKGLLLLLHFSTVLLIGPNAFRSRRGGICRD